VKYSCFILVFIFLFTNCRNEYIQKFPSELEPYVEEFILQANLHGLHMNLEDYNFEIKFGDIDDIHVAGSCNRVENLIIIDYLLWERKDEQEKEWLIFHELGHCLLDRGHRNEKTQSFECMSIMKGVEEDFECSSNLYSQRWRNYYIDELFDERTPFPDWYLDNQKYTNEFTKNQFSILIKDTLVEQIEFDSILFENYDRYLIEIEFGNWNTQENLVQINLGNFTFSNCNICTGNKTSLRSNNPRYRYYDSSELSFNSDIKLSIIRNQDILSFFVNETFVHAMEHQVIEGNLLRSNRFDELLETDLKILIE